MDTGSIKIGPYTVSRIAYDQIEPGDFLCTYEALTTRPDLLFIESAQKYGSFLHRPELNKMFHAEVILEKYPRIGVYKIAHADGMLKKTVIQDDNFKDHHPGQAFILFRAKDKAIRKEIVAVASKTAEPSSGHICKTLFVESLWYRIKFRMEFFLFENFGIRSSDKSLRHLQAIRLNYDQTGRFYGKDGSGAKEMSCMEYVANVVNVATSRVLCQSEGQKALEKNVLYTHLKELKKRKGLPLNFSLPDVTPASFVHFFLQNSNEFETVGYLGAITDPIQGTPLDIKGHPIQISSSVLSALLPRDMDTGKPFDTLYAAQAMKTLGVINGDWHIYPKVAIDPLKLKTLFLFLHSKLNNTTLNLKALPNLDKLSAAFIQKFQELVTYEKLEKPTEKQSKVGFLKQEEIQEILFLENELLKSAPIERTKKTLKISLNNLERELHQIERIKFIAHRLFNAGRTLLKTVIFALLYFGFKLAGNILSKIASTSEQVCRKKIEDILIVHGKIQKNGRLTLTTNDLVKDQRPWIWYSTDNWKTSELEPFIQVKTSWEAPLIISKGQDIKYKLFIGPADVNATDPIGKATTQLTEETIVTNHDLKIKNEKYQEYLVLPPVTPKWEERGGPRKSPIETYKKKCNESSPLENWPETIQDYERNYSSLEENLELLKVNGESSEDEIISHLKRFMEVEMSTTVRPQQIQLMKSGFGYGLSGDKIFKILDKDNIPILFVKVFMKSRGKFSREFFSLTTLEKLNLKTIKVPTVSSFSAGKIHDTRIYFLVTNYIQGVSVYDMFKDLLSHKVDSSDRKEKFKKLLHVYGKLGKGIAEFHTASKGEVLPIHSVFADILKLFSKNALAKLSMHLEPTFINKLQIYLDTRIPIESKKLFIRGYHHGDANTGNQIYDDATDFLYLVDWPDSSFSMGKDGKPLGIPFYDLVQIKNELINKKVIGLTDEEESRLYQEFENEYCKSGLLLPSIETMNFFSCIDLLGTLKWCFDKKKMLAPEDVTTADSIFKVKLAKLEALIT